MAVELRARAPLPCAGRAGEPAGRGLPPPRPEGRRGVKERGSFALLSPPTPTCAPRALPPDPTHRRPRGCPALRAASWARSAGARDGRSCAVAGTVGRSRRDGGLRGSLSRSACPRRLRPAALPPGPSQPGPHARTFPPLPPRPRHLIVAGGGGAGRSRRVGRSRCAGDAPVPRHRPRHAPAGEPQ